MSYIVLAAVWFVSFLSFPAFIAERVSLCLFIHKTINNMKMIILISLLSLITMVSCNTTDPKLESELILKLEDVSCTEAWIQLTTNNIQLPATINLLKNNSVTQTFSLSTQDSLIYIDSLLPNQSYSFQASSIQNPVSSNKVTTTTLDTTSHNFTWQTFEFGDIGAGSSLIYDVAIINENDIWAVGEIYMNDSLGNPDPSLYNLIKWDGAVWKPERVYFKDSQGQSFLAPMKSIFAFNANDVWIGLDQIINWDGVIYKSVELPDVVFQSWINKIWGSSNSDLYVVGNNGNIAHFNGSNWTKIESGTTSIIGDAWGISNDGISTVYCTVSSFFEPQKDRKILKIVNSEVDSISWKENKLLYSCWTNGNNYLYVCGSGVYQNKSGQWQQENLPSVSMNMVRGNAINDIFIIGDFGLAAHFNGSSWQVYNDGFGDIWGLAFQQNLVAFVGQKNGYGAITIGNKN